MKLVHFGRFALAASGLAMAMAVPAHAQLITNNHATQVTLTVAPATVESTARTSSSSMSGSGLGAVVLPVIGATGTITAGTAAAGPTGGAFSFSQSVADEDTVATVAVSGSTVTPPTYSNHIVQVGGTKDTLAGAASSNNGFTTTAGLDGIVVVAGGAGTTASVLQQNSVTVFK
ncbi:MAG: hypothetical protein KGQ93_10170 [Cyanobacteria bacterium REEB459]|nr:hypothetical protein [Cyanobacteria bacterium REEB459]